jgi:uncharacterized protein YjiS (DUF1127 family)
MTFEPRPVDLFSPQAPACGSNPAHPSAVAKCLAHARAWFAQQHERRRQRLMLRTLDNHLLADIGLSRADVVTETAKWPWQL